MANMDLTSAYRGTDYPVQILNVPKDRLENQDAASVVIHKPACVIDDAAAPGTGMGITGTIFDIDGNNVGIDIRQDMIYHHKVRNVLTYSGTEATFAQLNFGMKVYYDRSAGMPDGVLLSLSPLDSSGVANTLFGHIVWKQTEEPTPYADRDPYPLGSDSVGTTHDDVAILQGNR